MARYYVPTFLTDLYMGKDKKFTTPWVGICTGAQFLTQFPEFNVQKADVSAANQVRWDDNPGKMKQFFDWGHIEEDTPLVVWPELLSTALAFRGIPPMGPYGLGAVSSGIPTPGAASHKLAHLRSPEAEVVGDANAARPDPDGPHSHPETYNPGFTIPPEGIYPYQLYVAPDVQVQTHVLNASNNSVAPSPFTWMTDSLQEADTPQTGGTTREHPQLYANGNFLVRQGETPHGGWVVYGLFGVSGSSEYQEYDMYWLTPVFYKIHDGFILADFGSRPYARGWANHADYQALVDPSDTWYNAGNWISLTNSTGDRVILSGGSVGNPGPAGTYRYRIGTGAGVPGNPAQIYDTWEWRREYRLDKITPGLGYIKRREFGEVFPLMNLISEQETVETTTTGLLREGETPMPKFREEEDSLILRKTIAEYGL